MKIFLQKIKNIVKNNILTLALFIISNILQVPVHFGMFLAVGMSTDSGMNEMSVYIIRDLLSLICMLFMPIIMFIILGQFIALIIIIVTSRLDKKKNKSKKFNIKFYIILLIVQSAPYSSMLFNLHSNFDIDYRQERILEIKRDKGEIVEGTLLYDLCIRYLNLNDISDVKEMAKQDALIYSYEYKYISDYLDFIEYQSREKTLEKVLKIYEQDFPNDDYIIFNKSIFEYLDMIDKFIDEDIAIEDVYKNINKFMKKNIKFNPGDGRSTIDDLNYSLPIIITYENIRVLSALNNEYADDKYDKNKIKEMLKDSLDRVIYYVDTNSYYYQYGKETQLKDSLIYKQYCDIVNNLISMDYLNPRIINERLGWINEDFKLDLKNPKLLDLQILI